MARCRYGRKKSGACSKKRGPKRSYRKRKRSKRRYRKKRKSSRRKGKYRRCVKRKSNRKKCDKRRGYRKYRRKMKFDDNLPKLNYDDQFPQMGYSKPKMNMNDVSGEVLKFFGFSPIEPKFEYPHKVTFTKGPFAGRTYMMPYSQGPTDDLVKSGPRQGMRKNCWKRHIYPSGRRVGGYSARMKKCRKSFRKADYKGVDTGNWVRGARVPGAVPGAV